MLKKRSESVVVNGFAAKKQVDGIAGVVGGLWKKPSSNNERKVSRAWPPQSGGEGGNDAARTTTTTAAAADRRPVSSALTAGGKSTAIGSTNMGLTAPPLQEVKLRMKEMTGDDITGGNNNNNKQLIKNGERNGVDDVLNGNDSDDDATASSSDGELNYGPGIVNRLKEKFITLALRREYANSSTHVAPVRRVASLEQLLDVDSDEEQASHRGGFVDRTKFLYEQNASKNNTLFNMKNRALKRARSMDNVCGVDSKAYFNNQNQLRNAFLASKKIIIIEQPRPPVPPRPDNNHEAAVRKNAANGVLKMDARKASPSCLIDELPMPNTVQECKKLFEHLDEQKNCNVIGNSLSVKAKILPPKPVGVVPAAKVYPKVAVEEREAAENDAVLSAAVKKLPSAENEVGISSVKSRIDAFSGKITKSNSSANVFDPPKTELVCNNGVSKPVVTICPFREVDEEAEATTTEELTPPKIVDHIPAIVKPISVPSRETLHSQQPFETSNSVVFCFDNDDNKPRPYLPKIRPEKGNEEFWESRETSDNEDDDEADGAAGDGAPYAADYNFIGANVVVGRSSLLKTRNKKLQLLFDDAALSTYEYPSEYALLKDEEDVDMEKDNKGLATGCDNEATTGTVALTNNILNRVTGGLGNYTPLAVSNEHIFDLGMCRAPQPLPTSAVNPSSSAAEDATDDDDAISIKPAVDDQNVLWSSTHTSDILF